ncbi:MAG TPA: hypothetical protein VJ892_03535 [Candidatus Absconditabacterales bacterium]|nr:hypothetical protein [Candidatus Absconditabacterales bacterium]
MDILIEGSSEKFVRSFLEHHNVIVLNFSEYKKSKQLFGKLSFKSSFKEVDLEIITYLTDIESALFNFLMIGFKINYINFVDQNKLPEVKVQELIKNISKKVKEIKEKENEDLQKQKEQEKKIYKDENLEKILKIVEKTFFQIDSLLEKVGDNASQDKIRDINVMKQELTKLKMGRNDDKMTELLEKIYEKSDEIEKEYLDYLKQNIDYPIQGSCVSNIDIISENQKLKKAKKIKQIGAKRDKDDNYYLSFESTGLYLRFLRKDLKNKIKNISGFFLNLFDLLDFATIFIILITVLVLRFKKVSFSTQENLYNYAFLMKAGTFGLVLFFGKRFKKPKTSSNIFLLFFIILLSIGLFWFFKTNLSL